MTCPKCHSTDSFVRDSRAGSGTIWRRRACGKCGELFTTYELSKAHYDRLLTAETTLRNVTISAISLIKKLDVEGLR